MARTNPEFKLLETDVPHIGTMSSDFIAVLAAADRTDSKYEAIAAELNIPVGTVKSRLNRARKKLIAMHAADKEVV